ncbi:universal stress protein [Haloferax sp. ATB1]|uniref:universal stress protein n=1 Tax=Haloferax sp. ATB1 TaxID=1508454 RepID=UPI0005B20FCE|nr:universal stress protein [Haloferax sp. ATB1]
MTVVAAVDDSNRAATVLARASALAADLGEPLHSLHVLQRTDLVDTLEKEVEGQAVTENREVRRVGAEIIERAAANAELEHDTAEIENVVRVGDPAEQITTYADGVDTRYIVVGGRRRSPTGKALFGSVTQRVMLSSEVPVLNVPTSSQ